MIGFLVWVRVRVKIRIRVRVGVTFNVSVIIGTNCRRSKCRIHSHWQFEQIGHEKRELHRLKI